MSELALPLYKSHKTVRALEIASSIGVGDGNYVVSFKEKNYPARTLPAEMFSRYQPVEGDFYVLYDDGYASFSPRKAFIEGYRKIGKMPDKPTIAELEKILAEADQPVRINPDGSVELI